MATRFFSLRASAALALAVGVLVGCRQDAPIPVAPTVDLALLAAADLSPPAVVNWHAQQASLGKTGTVEGASAHLVRNANGLSFRITTNSLTPGHAYTLWLVVIDNPGACTATPCGAPDFVVNPEPDAQVRYAAGGVVGGSGRGTFAGSVRKGPMSGWLPGRSFDNPMGAEVHLVINDHGPMLPDFMPGMIRTYRGGCANNSPFPPFFPATALGDGEVGPNTCRLYQFAVFTAP